MKRSEAQALAIGAIGCFLATFFFAMLVVACEPYKHQDFRIFFAVIPSAVVVVVFLFMNTFGTWE